MILDIFSIEAPALGATTHRKIFGKINGLIHSRDDILDSIHGTF